MGSVEVVIEDADNVTELVSVDGQDTDEAGIDSEGIEEVDELIWEVTE